MHENQLATTQRLSYSKEQIELIKKQIAPDATPDELKLFLYQAQRTGLDALSRQIYCIHRNVKQGNGWGKKMTIQTSIDGFRVIAERTGTFGGSSEPIFEEKDGKLFSCTMSIYRFRGDVRYEACVSKVFWDEYCQVDASGNPTGLWKKLGRQMLAKVCESNGLRRAFPQDLSGIYTGDEMEQADAPIYIKKHETDEDIELAIDLCETLDELINLYSLNSVMVETSANLKKLFTKKKQSI